MFSVVTPCPAPRPPAPPGGISYQAAQRLGEVQWAIVEELCEPAGVLEARHVDLRRASQLIDERLVPLQRSMGVDLTQIAHGVEEEEGEAEPTRARL